MKQKDKQDLEKYIKAIKIARELRTFPNGRNMSLHESVSLNNIGKFMELIDYPLLEGLVKGKKNKSLFKIIRQCRIQIEKKLRGS